MQSRIMQLVTGTLLVVTLAVVTACGTIQYRDVQGEFVDAVAADNAWAVSPFGANAAEGLYSSILVQLTDDYIAKLDDRLEPNAWLLRAVSEWRLGEFIKARSSAKKGLKTLQTNQHGSRDDVMLTMLDGLIVDSDLLARYRALTDVTLNDYETTFSANFETALKALDDGFAKAGPATPVEVGWYYHYHRWRLIQNWRSVVNSIVDDEDRGIAKADAMQKVCAQLRKPMNEEELDCPSLRQSMDAERDTLPDNHPLRELIRAQGGG